MVSAKEEEVITNARKSDIADDEPGTAPKRGLLFRVSHGTLWVTFRILGGLFAILTLAAILVGWRLSQGPISLSFLTPYIQEQAGELPGGYSITLSDTVLAWRGWDNQLDILALDSELKNSGGRSVMRVPEMAILFDGASLIKGKLRPSEITIRGARLQLVRRPDGQVGFIGEGGGGNEAAGADAAAPQRGSFLRQWLLPHTGAQDGDTPSALTDSITSRLRQVRLKGAAFSLRDDLAGGTHIVSNADVWIRNRRQNLDLDASLVWVSRMGRIPLTLTANYDVAADAIDGEFLFNNLVPAEFQQHYNIEPALAGMNVSISGRIRGTASAATGLQRVDFDVVSGKGSINLANFSHPWPVDRLAAAGSYTMADRQLVVSSATYQTGKLEISAAGKIDLKEDLPGVFLTVTGKDINAAHIVRYWPVNRAAQTRGWLLSHIRSGHVEAAKAELKVLPHLWGKDVIPADTLNVDFSFRDVHAILYPPYDDLKKAAGRGRLTGKSFDLTLERASSGPLRVKKGHLKLPDLGKSEPDVIIDLVAEGTVRQMMNAVIRGDLKRNLAQNVNPDDFDGDAAARLHMALPAKDDVKVAEMTVQAAANVRGLVARNAFQGRTVSAKTAVVKVDLDGLSVEGDFLVEGTPMGINWTEEFAAGLEYSTHIKANIPRISVPELAGLGINLPSSVGGDMALAAEIHQGANGLTAATVTADVLGISINEPDIALVKLAGQAGALSFSAYSKRPGAYRLTDLKLQSPALGAEGEIEIDPELGVWFVDLKSYRNGDTDVAVTLVNKDGRGWNGRIAGPSLDLRPILAESEQETAPAAEAAQAAPKDGGDTYLMKFDIARLQYDDDIFFTGARGEFKVGPDGIDSVNMTGRIGDVADTKVTLERSGVDHLINLETENAGAMLGALGVSGQIQGGTGVASATRKVKGGEIKGLVVLEDIVVNDAPAMAKLMTLASFTGLANRLSGQGVEFKRAEALFAMQGDRLDIIKGRMGGPAVGLTAKGKYNFADRKITMVGTVIPAFAITSLLGNIPILGDLLVADQGLLGVTYRVEGPVDDPNVSANPLSALAPGILKRMFVESVENTPITTEEFNADGTEGN